MGNNCAYCGAYFEAKRSNKKYCSDNCKQMAYFTRNGFTLSGGNNSAPVITNETETNNSPQEHTATVKQELPTVKYNSQAEQENVKYDTEKTENDFKETENIQEKFCIPNPFAESDINSIKTPVNYCGSCENPLLKYFTKSVPIENKETKTEQNLIQKDETHQSINSREPLPNSKKNEAQAKQEEKANELIQKADPEEKPYQWVNSKYIRQVEFFISNSDTKNMLKNPLRYWSYEQAKHFNWVNTRLLCLIESLIKLSNYSQIDTHTLLCVADAFGKLSNSFAYKNLPNNYPYKELIAELCAKVVSITEHKIDKETFPFRLSLQRKAQLVAIRNAMCDNVASIKFSELDFTEEQSAVPTKPNSSYIENDEDEESEEETLEEMRSKKQRTAFEDWKRKRRLNKAA